MGAWIEIEEEYKTVIRLAVAPLVGAWIEIQLLLMTQRALTSLLSWERGLKYTTDEQKNLEMGRSSRGSVD